MLHVYGVLGDPWEGSKPFGTQNAHLASIATELRTYHEEFDNAEHERKIRELLGTAEKVIFLGFGFHPNNLQLLFPNYEFHDTQLWGTSMGCENSESFARAQRTQGSRFESVNCTDFLRNVGVAILDKPWIV